MFLEPDQYEKLWKPQHYLLRFLAIPWSKAVHSLRTPRTKDRVWLMNICSHGSWSSPYSEAGVRRLAGHRLRILLLITVASYSCVYVPTNVVVVANPYGGWIPTRSHPVHNNVHYTVPYAAWIVRHSSPSPLLMCGYNANVCFNECLTHIRMLHRVRTIYNLLQRVQHQRRSDCRQHCIACRTRLLLWASKLTPRGIRSE